MGQRLNSYDVVIAGAGASGLSLAWYLSQQYHELKVVVIDRTFEARDDKTWCFWDENIVMHPSMLHHQWNHLTVQGKSKKTSEKLKKHTYSCIRSGKFIDYIVKTLRQDERITLLTDEILSVVPGLTSTDEAKVITKNNGTLSAGHVFHSIRSSYSDIKPVSSSNVIWQHFLGWDIRTEAPVFDPKKATLMDFRVPQIHGFAFVYLLPFTETEALAEITYFSPEVPERTFYSPVLERYLLDNLKIGHLDREPAESHKKIKSTFSILREETGVIPMIDLPFTAEKGHNLHAIGVSSGITKPSSGYAFSRIVRQSQMIAHQLLNGYTVRVQTPSTFRFRYYDMLILDIIRRDPEKAVKIFETLFSTCGFDNMLTFLDEHTSFTDDLKVMASVPDYFDFFRAMGRTVHKIPKL